MNIVGDLLFDITKIREKAWKLIISIKANVKSIEDTTNSAVEMTNGYLDMRRGPVDSRGKAINEFLAQVGQAFEDLEHNGEEQYMQLSAMVNTTVIDDPWREVLGRNWRILGGLFMLFILEVISRAVESKVFKEYIEELTRAEQTTREIRKAIVSVASLGSCVYKSSRATWGMDEGFILGVYHLF